MGLETSVRGAHALVAGRAVGEHGSIFPVHAVARAAGKLGGRMMIERRSVGRARRARHVGVALVAGRRRPSRPECVARQARRRGLISAAMVGVGLARVTLRARDLRGRRVQARVALRARDLLRADMEDVHRRFARRLPGRGHLLHRRERWCVVSDRDDREHRSDHESEDQERERATPLHCAWQARQGWSRVMSNALAKPRP